MSSALKTISPNEYLRRERAAQTKSEFFQGEMFAMAGGSATHSLISANFLGEVRQALKQKNCVAYNSDLRVKVSPSGLYTYPDATIVCGMQHFEDELNDTLLNPTLVAEVLSDSTEKYDRGRKSDQYRQNESLQEIVLISQANVHIECYRRQPQGGWLMTEEKRPQATVHLTSLDVSIALGELYRHVDFNRTPI